MQIYPARNALNLHLWWQIVSNVKYLKSFLFGAIFPVKIINVLNGIVSPGKHLSNTNLSDLSIVGTRDIFVYR